MNYFVQIMLLLVLSTPLTLKGQNNAQDLVYYSLVFQDCCSEDIKSFGAIYTDWYIKDINDSISYPENNQVELKSNENYFLFNEGFGIINEVINTNSRNKIDTIKTTCIKVVYPDEYFTWTPLHLKCNDTINGQYIEYHYNGKLSLKGNFNNGLVHDTLKRFYSNTKIMSLDIVTDSRVIHTTFHTNGKPSYHYDSKKEYTISYFKDGTVKSKRSNSGVKSFNKYSKDQIWYKIKRNKQVFYYENGKLDQKLTRKPLSFLDRFRPNKKNKTFIYKFEKYDTTGTIVKKVMFYDKSFQLLNTAKLYRALNNFSSLTYYVDGDKKVSFWSVNYNGDRGSYPVMYRFYEYENNKFSNDRDLFKDEFTEIQTKYEEELKLSTRLTNTK